jgi:hypothetical protein
MSNSFITKLQAMSLDELTSYSKVVPTSIKGNAELLKMSLADLQAYSTSLIHSIEYNTMVIDQSQRQENIIARRIMLSQSSSHGYRREMINNNNLLLAYNAQYAEVLENNRVVDETVQKYKKLIEEDTATINTLNNLILGLQIKSSSISTSLQGSSFEERATYYSSLYIDYMLADSLYTDCINSTIELNSIYEESLKLEEEAYSTLLRSADEVLSTTTELTELYVDKAAVHSTLTGETINETLYTNAYNSTSAGLTAINELFEIATLFSNYNELVEAQKKNMESYNTAYSYYTAVNNTSNTISGATSAGWLSLMATLSDTESTINMNMSNTSNSILTRLEENEIISISTANAAVDINKVTTSTLEAYITLAQSSFEYNSTLNEDANTRLINHTNQYIENMADYTTNVNTSNEIFSTINADSDLDTDMIITRIKMIPKIRRNLLSTFNDSIEYSTLMNDTYEKSMTDYKYYLDIYNSTSKNIIEVNALLTDNTTSTYTVIADVNTFSTMVDITSIDMEAYDIESKIHYTLEELAAMQYRYTYVVSKRMDAKKIYENCVMTQVQQVAGTITIPAAVNLAVNTIATAYTNLNTVNTFLNRFTSIYYNYTAHMGNLHNISTLVGNKAETYSSITTYRQESYLNPNDISTANALITAQTTLDGLTFLVENSSPILATTQSIIENDKLNFMRSYMNTFPASEVIETESTISSFLEAGFLMPSQ